VCTKFEIPAQKMKKKIDINIGKVQFLFDNTKGRSHDVNEWINNERGESVRRHPKFLTGLLVHIRQGEHIVLEIATK
jgi:hypothetical protein